MQITSPPSTVLFCSKFSTNSTRDTDPTDLHGLSSGQSPSSSTWTAADPLDSSNLTLAEAPSVPRDTAKPLNLVETISDVALKKVCENDGEMAIRIGGREVYRSTSRLLGTQESRVHSFAIVDHPPIFSVDLKVGKAAHFECKALTFAFCWDMVRNIRSRALLTKHKAC